MNITFQVCGTITTFMKLVKFFTKVNWILNKTRQKWCYFSQKPM